MGRIKMPPLEAKQILSYILRNTEKFAFRCINFEVIHQELAKMPLLSAFVFRRWFGEGARCGAELIDEAKFSLVLQQLLLCVDTNTIFKTFLVPDKKTFLVAQKSYYKIRT